MARKLSLNVNGKTIDLNPFLEGYFYHVASGMISSLRDTTPIKTLEMNIDSDGLLTVTLNGTSVPVNEFVIEIVRNTFAGMIANLKDVDEEMKTLSLSVTQ